MWTFLKVKFKIIFQLFKELKPSKVHEQKKNNDQLHVWKMKEGPAVLFLNIDLT